MIASSLLHAVDFSSLYIPSIADAAAQQLAQSGVSLAIIGYDSAPASAAVSAAIIRAGMAWDAYRLPVAWVDVAAQVDDTLKGIAAAVAPPGYLHLDIEPVNGRALSIAQLEAAMDAVEAAGVTPTAAIKPSIYSAAWVWQAYYPGYTGPADRGWALWCAWWNAAQDLALPPFGGWQAEQTIGHQYAGSSDSPIGAVDLSVFAGRAPSAPPNPVQPGSALARLRSAQDHYRISGDERSAGDADLEAAVEDLTQ